MPPARAPSALRDNYRPAYYRQPLDRPASEIVSSGLIKVNGAANLSVYREKRSSYFLLLVLIQSIDRCRARKVNCEDSRSAVTIARIKSAGTRRLAIRRLDGRGKGLTRARRFFRGEEILWFFATGREEESSKKKSSLLTRRPSNTDSRRIPIESR